MSYHPGLGRWMQTDPIPYVDGMNLYEFARGSPAGRTDPSGLISIDPAAPDSVRKAYETLANDPVGKKLLDDVKAAEAASGNSVVILGRAQRLTKGSSSDNVVRGGKLNIYIDPRDEIGIDEHGEVIASKTTGDGPCDVELGIEMDEMMFHELSHALHVLTGTDRWTGLPPDVKPDSPGEDDFLARWQYWEERNTVQEENKYNKSRGYTNRARYRTTDEQNQESAFIASRLMHARSK